MSELLKNLSNEDLLAIEAGDMSKVSEAGLMALSGNVKSTGYTKGQGESNPVIRGLVNAVSGPTFGFSDEIGGLIGGAASAIGGGTFVDGYRQSRDYLRGVQDEYKKEFPVGSAVTQMMAAAPTMVGNPFSAVSRVAPNIAARVGAWSQVPRVGLPAIAARSVQAGATGAAYGGLAGLGGSDADSILGMAADTGLGALQGGALGAATPGVSAVAMGGYNQIASRVSNSAAEQFARQKVAEALSRDARGAVFEGGASNAGQQAISRFGKLGPEARVVDAGGQNTRQLLDTVVTLPGRSKNLVEGAIHERQAGRGERLISAADSAMGANGQRLNEGIAGWMEARSLLARPLYNRVYQMRVEPSDELQAVVRAAEELGAAGQARRIATANRSQYTLSAAGQQATPGSSLMNNGQQGRSAQWSMRDLDYLKQGLDDIVQSNMDEAGRLNKLGFAVDGLRRNLVRELDRLTTGPDGQSLYQIARETFAGPSAMIDAARRGKTAFMQDEAAIRQAMNGLSGSEADAFRLGAFEALRGKLGKMSGQTEIINMWRDSATREKLQAVFGTERAFREFAATAAREGRLKGLESVGRGSQTASRQYGAGDLDMSPMLQAANAATSGSPAGLLAAGANIWNRARTPEPVRDQIGGLLLSRDPNVMRDLGLLTPMLTAERNRRAQMSGGFSGLLTGAF